jgi:hypothetical protein
MTSQVKLKMAKQNPQIGFYQQAPEVKQHIQDTYIATGRMNVSIEFNNETNTLTATATFASEDDRMAYLSDPVIVAENAKRDAFNASHGIQIVVEKA